MPDHKSDTNRFSDPWPTRQPSWPARPWIMSGTVVTAWFTLEHGAISTMLSPDLVPTGEPTRPSRLRFYDIEYHSGSDTSAGDGRFKEAVVAFPASYGEETGEVSAFMWSDSDTYIHWGREVFGWPVLRGGIDLEGAPWENKGDSPGAARLSVQDGTAGIEITGRCEEVPPARNAQWFTPRLIPLPGRPQDARELLVVRPKVLDPGIRYGATGRAWINFEARHPLGTITVPANAEIEIASGFVLRVGDDIAVL